MVEDEMYGINPPVVSGELEVEEEEEVGYEGEEEKKGKEEEKEGRK